MTTWQWKVIVALVRVVIVIIDNDKTGLSFQYHDLITLREAEDRNRP